MKSENVNSLSLQAIQRMPYYLQYLKKLHENGEIIISSSVMAKALLQNEVQVRKDMAAISINKGKPHSGFCIDELINGIEDFLGYNNTMESVLVGVGSLGKALLAYKEFEKYGLNIVCAFDIDENIVEREISSKKVLNLNKLEDLCERLHIHIGIITVPAEEAQKIADIFVKSGIKAIWNFAPVKLSVPKNVILQNENLASSLAILSRHLKSQNP